MGSRPPNFEWQTRYEVNLFLGISLCVYGLVTAVLERAPANVARATIAAGALSFLYGVVQSSSIGVDFLRDSQKQDGLISSIAALKSPLEGSFIVVVDETQHQNAMGRFYRPYEWTGIFYTAFGTQSTYGVGAQSQEAATAAYEDYLENGTWRPGYDYTWQRHLDDSKGYVLTIRENLGGQPDSSPNSFNLDYREIK
jgi:hypothetical protein